MSVITLTGPTCAGKSTLEAELQRLGCGRAISHTTRLPRVGEKHGVHYYYIADHEFDQLDAADEFIETVSLGTRRYAMSKASIREAVAETEHAVIVVDPHGAVQIRKFCIEENIDHYPVWVDCGVEEQARRWVARLVRDVVDADGMISMDAMEGGAERLAIMMQDEQVWRQAARHGRIRLDDFASYRRYVVSTVESPQVLARALLDGLNDRLKAREPKKEQWSGPRRYTLRH